MDAGAGAAQDPIERPGRNGVVVRNGSWLEPLSRELEDADAPRSFFFRDDDAGWANDRLLSLLDLFAHHGVPLDVAVIPAALDAQLAASLRRRHEIERGASSVRIGRHAPSARTSRPARD